jgi:hypothetical protein
MKFTAERPSADPEAAARKLIGVANSVEAVQDGRIHIEKINGPFLFEFKDSPDEYGAGLKLAIDRGWLMLDRSGTYANSRKLARTCSPDVHSIRGTDKEDRVG